MDNFVNSSPKSLKNVREIVGAELGKNIVFERLDLTDYESSRALFQKYGRYISHVIHFAGLKAVAESISNPIEYYRDNIDSALVVLRLMDEFAIKNIIFSSSATVYGSRNVSPLKEDAKKLEPTNPYGKTKLFIEEILRDKCVANSDMQAVLLRYFNPIGAHPSGLIGESPRGVPNNLMPYILQVAQGRLPFLHVYGNDYATKDKTAERDFIHVMDLAEGHAAAIRYQTRGAHVINLGTGKPSSVKHLIACVASASGKEIRQEINPRRKGDLESVFADPTKAKEVLKWEAKRSLDDACRDGWKWQKMSPKGFE